ncbi:MAG: hypothetical protein IPJ29_10475 [Chitinophagaceae bacterium]|nr:hypothetical protein [Chitinophagaceae bacterium]
MLYITLGTAHTSFKQYLQAIPIWKKWFYCRKKYMERESDDYLEGLGILANAYKETEK